MHTGAHIYKERMCDLTYLGNNMVLCAFGGFRSESYQCMFKFSLLRKGREDILPDSEIFT